MGLIDELKQQMGSVLAGVGGAGEGSTAAAPSALIDNVFGMIKSQGLGNIVEQFSKNGLGEIVESWVGKGANLPIDPAQIKAALGSESLQQIASRLGLPLDNVSDLLSKVLPGMVDKLTPGGSVDETALAGIEAAETTEWQTPLGN